MAGLTIQATEDELRDVAASLRARGADLGEQRGERLAVNRD
jgi:hypothetical protein